MEKHFVNSFRSLVYDWQLWKYEYECERSRSESIKREQQAEIRDTDTEIESYLSLHVLQACITLWVCLIFSVSVLMNRGMWLSLQNYYTKYDFFSCLTIIADLLLACLLETFMSLPFFLLEYKVLVLISFTNTFLYRSKIFTQLQKYKWNRLLAVKLSKTHRVLLGSTKLLFAVWLLKEIKVCVTCKSLKVPGSHPNSHSWDCLFTLLPLKLELF